MAHRTPKEIKITPGALVVFIGIGIAFYYYYKNYDYAKLTPNNIETGNKTSQGGNKVPQNPQTPDQFNLQTARERVQSQHYFNRMHELSKTLVFPSKGEVADFEDFGEGKYKEVLKISEVENVIRFHVGEKILLEEWQTPEARYIRKFSDSDEVEMFEMVEKKSVDRGEVYEKHSFQYLQNGRELKLIDQFGPQIFSQTFFDGQKIDGVYSPDGKEVQPF